MPTTRPPRAAGYYAILDNGRDGLIEDGPHDAQHTARTVLSALHLEHGGRSTRSAYVEYVDGPDRADVPLPDDGFADGGERYTADEMELMTRSRTR